MMPSPTSRFSPLMHTTNYGSNEVQWLVEDYAELTYKRYLLGIMVRLLDLEVAMKKLSRPYYQAILLCGIAGYTTRNAGTFMGVSQTTMHIRYTKGLIELTEKMNGGKKSLRLGHST